MAEEGKKEEKEELKEATGLAGTVIKGLGDMLSTILGKKKKE